jgi:Tfp pilus assembly protein PilW
MHRVVKRLRAARRDERGLTLNELLVSISITLMIVAAGYAMMGVAQRGQPRIAERAAALQEGRQLMERLSRELRLGTGIDTVSTASRLTIWTYVKKSSCGGTPSGTSIECRVTYDCSAEGTCTRVERNTDGTGGAVPTTAVTGLATNQLFSYTPSAADADFVGVRLEFPAEEEGEDAVTLEDGVALRNSFATQG